MLVIVWVSHEVGIVNENLTRQTNDSAAIPEVQSGKDGMWIWRGEVCL